MSTRQPKPSIEAPLINTPDAAALGVTNIPIHKLKHLSRQMRRHSAKQIKKLCKTIAAHGFLIPIIIDNEGYIICGEARVAAANKLGYKTIPAIQVDHLTNEQLRTFRLAENRIGEDAAWDDENVALELQELFELDVDLEFTGFDTPEIDASFALLEDTTPDNTIDEIPAADEIPKRVSAGQTWRCGDHILICGDATEASVYAYLATLGTPLMMFTDPPYNVAINGHVCGKGKIKHAEFAMASGEMSEAEFTNFLAAFLSASSNILPDGSLLYVCIDWRHVEELQTAAKICDLTLLNICVWNKSNAGMGSLYRSKHELILVLKKGNGAHKNNVELGKHGRNRTNVWDYPSVNSNDPTRKGDLAFHPTVKPVQLVADAILDVTARKNYIIDPFGGSGTTMLAAGQTGRRAMLIELEPHYCDVILARFEAATGITPYLSSTLDMMSDDPLPVDAVADCNPDSIPNP